MALSPRARGRGGGSELRRFLRARRAQDARLERGIENRPGPSVVDALARALLMDDHEREHLRKLVARAARTDSGPVTAPGQAVSPGTLLVLESMRPNPAVVVTYGSTPSRPVRSRRGSSWPRCASRPAPPPPGTGTPSDRDALRRHRLHAAGRVSLARRRPRALHDPPGDGVDRGCGGRRDRPCRIPTTDARPREEPAVGRGPRVRSVTLFAPRPKNK